MIATTALQLARELASVVGPEHISDDSALLTAFAIDGVRAAVAVAPGNAEEVAAIIRLANERQLTVTACGGFTMQSLGARPAPIDVLLRTDRLNQMLHYDPGDLTIGVSAGMRVADVQRTAAQNNLLLPLDVPRAANATVGGTLAAATSGPLKHGYGGVREFCIGVTFVTGDGRIAKAGGRVVKNVAGYDLMKLLIGSHGTLGVIVSANFKLFPAPRQSCTFLADFATLGDALAFRRFVQHSPLSPLCLELISPLAHAYVGLDNNDDRWTIALRAGGSDTVLARYRKELGTSIRQELAANDEKSFWSAIQDFTETVSARHHNALSLWLHEPSSEVGTTLPAAAKVATDHNFLFACTGRAGLATLNLALIPISVDPPSVMQYANAVSSIRGVLPRDGVAIVHRCPREAKDHVNVWGSSVNDVESMKAVKHVLDPKNILNRGRFLF
jgi:glycolate oxidase FAD binding subunit